MRMLAFALVCTLTACGVKGPLTLEAEAPKQTTPKVAEVPEVIDEKAVKPTTPLK